MSASGPRFSLVVATLDEAAEIEETLKRARIALGDRAELVVVDAGSRDLTAAIAARHAVVLQGPPCRGAQLARGATATSGEVLVFLHADTWLSPDAGDRIDDAIERGAVGGCLRFAIRGPPRVRYRVLSRCVNLRTRLFRTATGDQAIFARRDAYEACGGIPSIPLFEDVRLVRGLRRQGPFVPTMGTAATSPRRWERQGFLRTVIGHLVLRAAFASGVSPHRLARTYRFGKDGSTELPTRPGNSSSSPSGPASRSAPRTSDPC